LLFIGTLATRRRVAHFRPDPRLPNAALSPDCLWIRALVAMNSRTRAAHYQISDMTRHELLPQSVVSEGA